MHLRALVRTGPLLLRLSSSFVLLPINVALGSFEYFIVCSFFFLPKAVFLGGSNRLLRLSSSFVLLPINVALGSFEYFIVCSFFFA